MSAVDERYERYQDDAPDTVERVELGARVLHWMFLENLDGPGSQLAFRVVTRSH